MEKFEIRTMVKKEEIDSTPKISHKVREYVWNYIYKNLLKSKKVMTDDKSNYRLTFDLKKFDPEKHKFFTDSPFNNDDDKFRPEPKFNKQGDLKFALLSVVSTRLGDSITPRVYAELIYDALGSFIILISKKITKEELDELKKGMNYEEIESYPYPASTEEIKLFTY